MTPSDYCRARIGGPGTDLYYALWHLPAAQRDALTALHALAIELADAPRECREPELAHTKLAWWREEIERAAHGRASHPATQVLAPWLRQGALAAAPLIELVAAAAAEVGSGPATGFDDLHARQQRATGAVAMLAAGLLGTRDATALDSARALGTLHGLARALAEAGADLRAGRVCLPTDELAQFGLAGAALLDAGETAAWRAFMGHQVARLVRLYDDALAAVPADRAEPLIPDIIMAALQQALLAEIRAADYSVLSQRITLTPLRRLWIAWRTRRSKPARRLG